MKLITQAIRIVLPVLFFMVCTPDANGQIWKKIKKRSEKAAEEAVIRKTEEKVYKETSKGMDSILEPGKKGKKPTDKDGNPIPQGDGPNGDQGGDTGQGGNDAPTPQGESGPKSIQVYSKFDFVPGDKVVFFDDFSNDYVGDFPSKWNTNGSGEIVAIGDDSKKWLELKPGYGIVYIPDVSALPAEYTIEFDLFTQGIDQQTSSTAVLKVGVSDDASFKWGNFANVDIPFCQYAPVGFYVRNGGTINNNIDGDIRDKVLVQPRISIAVNKQRFRLWVDEKKYIDIPRMIPAGTSPTNIKFELRQFKDGKERLFITNLKVAEGGQDLRAQLIAEGRVSTNAILFDSGSANLQAQSMGVIRQISQVLQQESGMNLNIIGHTDSDGDDAANMELSKKRAEAVKNALVNVYNVSADRLQTEGKGESEPVGDNGTTDGKAQNRRVEFVKI